MSLSGTYYVPNEHEGNEHEAVDQYDSYAIPSKIIPNTYSKSYDT